MPVFLETWGQISPLVTEVVRLEEEEPVLGTVSRAAAVMEAWVEVVVPEGKVGEVDQVEEVAEERSNSWEQALKTLGPRVSTYPVARSEAA